MCESKPFQWKELILKNDHLSLNYLNREGGEAQGSRMEIRVYDSLGPALMGSWELTIMDKQCFWWVSLLVNS